MVELKLSVLDLPLQPFSGWLYLQDQNKVSLPTRRREESVTVLHNNPNSNIFRVLEKETWAAFRETQFTTCK